MSKFKVGDKVRVTDASRPNEIRKRFVGKILTVASINPNGDCWGDWKGDHYGFDRDSDAYMYVFFDDELEPAPFTKADLKDGMVVEYRNGYRRLVVGSRFMGQTGSLPTISFKDDLTIKTVHSPDFDIVKVYETSGEMFNDIFQDRNLTLVWERKEEEPHKEMTVAEIEEKLGYKIKVVADKE